MPRLPAILLARSCPLANSTFGRNERTAYIRRLSCARPKQSVPVGDMLIVGEAQRWIHAPLAAASASLANIRSSFTGRQSKFPLSIVYSLFGSLGWYLIS